MQSEINQILPLPVEVAAQLKSSTAIPSQDCVVLGLVENALDASASRIEVSVDFPRGSCSVEDDGYGIHPIEFSEIGGLGKPHCTSRSWPGQETFSCFSDFTRYLKARSFCDCIRRPGSLSIFAGCIVNSDSNLSPLCFSIAFDFDFASFKTCRQIGAGANTSYSFMS